VGRPRPFQEEFLHVLSSAQANTAATQRAEFLVAGDFRPLAFALGCHLADHAGLDPVGSDYHVAFGCVLGRTSTACGSTRNFSPARWSRTERLDQGDIPQGQAIFGAVVVVMGSVSTGAMGAAAVRSRWHAATRMAGAGPKAGGIIGAAMGAAATGGATGAAQWWSRGNG